MTLAPGLRVRRDRRDALGSTVAKPYGLPHRTVVAWDDRPDTIQFVDDDLLTVVTAEQAALDL